MDELNILDQIASNTKSGFKSNILMASKNNKRLADLLDAALNFKRKFFIKKFNIPAAVSTNKDAHYEFINLLTKLESGTIRGDLAQAEVETFLGTLNEQQQTWYTRVIRKDLKAGIAIDTVIKCGFNIPNFDVALAKDGKNMKNLSQFVSKGGFASRKFDGYRCLAVIRNGDVSLYSRNGTIYTNFSSIEEALQKEFPKGNWVFDGEIMSDDFISMQKSAFANKRGTTVGDVKYHIFDMIPYSEWDSQSFKLLKSERYKALVDTLAIVNNPLLKLVDHTVVNQLSVLQNLEQQYIAEGYEGAMFMPNIPYYFGKKSNKMIKMKTFKSMEVKILGFYKGKEDSKYANTLGGVTVLQENGVECDCGSGFNDEDRDYIWNNQSEFLNRVFEASYQELTEDNKMRFPTFHRWRNDKV